MNEPWTETTKTEIGYSIGEPAKRTRVVRVLDEENLTKPEDLAAAILLAAGGLVAPTAGVSCSCEGMYPPEIYVAGWLP